MSTINLSPEEILKRRELEGGLSYDDPVMEQSQIILDTPPQQEQIQTPVEKISEPVIPKPIEPSVYPEAAPASLGKAQSYSSGLASDEGWKNLPVSILPTEGLYYPDGTSMAIRAAEVREIRHFSTIDEDDRLDIEEKLSYVLDRCLRIDFPGEGVVSYKDLKQEDRFFIVMAIRDLTFVKGENSILLKTKKKCNQTPECPFNNGIELRTGVLSAYEIEENVLKYYNPQTRSFIFTIKKTGKRVEMFIPSIGVSQAIASFIREAAIKSKTIDEGFLQISPFIFDEWRTLTFDQFINKMRECDYWTKEEYSVYFELSERIKVGTKMEAKQNCPVCGGMEVTADITFPGGIRSLFLISDIFGQLL
jgi:hypothetical protein